MTRRLAEILKEVVDVDEGAVIDFEDELGAMTEVRSPFESKHGFESEVGRGVRNWDK